MKQTTFARALTVMLSVLLGVSPGLSTVALAEELEANNNNELSTLDVLEQEDASTQDESNVQVLQELDAESEANQELENVPEPGLVSDQEPVLDQEQDDIQVVAQSDPGSQEGTATSIELIEDTQQQKSASNKSINVQTESESASVTPVLSASGYAQGKGAIKATKTTGGVTIGSKQSGTSLTGIKLSLSDGAITYKAYAQKAGWQKQKASGELAGNKGTGKLLGAVKIELSDDLSQDWSIRYRCYVQSKGWLGWAADGAVAGITDNSGRVVNAIEVRIVPKDSTSARGGGKAWIDAGLTASAHVEGTGWQAQKSGYNIRIGTTGKSLRLEALKISRSDGIDVAGNIVYKAHVQNTGWQGKRSNGRVAGTIGQGLRVEAISVQLTGELGQQYDIWYRVHASGAGWLAWASNGSNAGTEGLSLQIEAIQLALVRKGSNMPSQKGQNISIPFITKSNVRYAAEVSGTWTTWKKDGKNVGSAKTGAVKKLKMVTDGQLAGSIKYSVRPSGLGWQKYVSNGAVAQKSNKSFQAIRVKLTGELGRVYNVWYRCYVKGYGWTGWAKNGATCGSVDADKPITAVRVCLRSRALDAPGSTANTCFKPFTSGDKELDKILDTIVKNVTGTGSDALRKGYDYVSSFPYRSGSKWPSGSWKTWSVGFAKEMYNNHSGNCYRYASLMCWIARRLGYDAKVISGEVLAYASGRSAHGWCEIKIDGKTYVLDPDLQWEIPSRSFYLKTYDNAPVYYYK
ncbi:MAG: transglutaminase domain-containing protein [Coriobacteriales bacterium]|nr:transglutaminase domain-containing protein [Coriobacteriales bacterium]